MWPRIRMPCDTLQFTIGGAGIEIVTGVHVIVKYALRYFTITCTGKDQALHLQLPCTITAALQLTAMLWLNTFHNSTFRLFRISNTHARLQACKVHSVCTMHSTLYSACAWCIQALQPDTQSNQILPTD